MSLRVSASDSGLGINTEGGSRVEKVNSRTPPRFNGIVNKESRNGFAASEEGRKVRRSLGMGMNICKNISVVRVERKVVELVIVVII